MADKKDEDQGQEAPDTQKAEVTESAETTPETEALTGEIIDDAPVAEDTVAEAEPEETEVASDPEPVAEDIQPEPETDPEPEIEDAQIAPEPEKIIERVEKVVERRGGFFPMFLGGIAAAAVGFLVARTDAIAPYLPEALRGADYATPIAANAAALDSLKTASDAQSGQISETGQQVADLTKTLDGTNTTLTGRLDGVDSSLSDISKKVADLGTDLNNLSIPDIAPLQADIASLKRELESVNSSLREATAGLTSANQSIETLRTRMDSSDVRTTTLEKRPIAENLSDDAIAAYERELDAVRRALAEERGKIYTKLDEDRSEITRLMDLERGKINDLIKQEQDKFTAMVGDEGDRLKGIVDSQSSEISKLLDQAKAMIDDAHSVSDKTKEIQANAVKAEQLAAAQTAAAKLRGALEDGTPYQADLDPIAEAGVAVPDALSAAAAEGLITQSALEDEFAPAARAALNASRLSDPESTNGIGNFLKRQLGARSVTPQEGDSTDAVLSRTEAALNKRDLKTALTELQALNDTAAAEMANWVQMATARRDALDGFDSVTSELNSN